jgi:predicted permease
MVLLIGAGLLIRTFLNLSSVNPGFRPDGVLTFQLSLPPERYDSAALSRFSLDLERALRRLPGVSAAGAINQLPLDDAPNWATPYITAIADPNRGSADADARLVTPGYFAALHATLVSGRWFTEQDDPTQPLALIVDERLVRKVWPKANPLQQQLSVRVMTDQGPTMRWGSIVGVVRHLRHHRLSEEVREQVFIPFAQAPRNQMGVVVHAAAPLTLMPAITQAIHAIDPALGPSRVELLDRMVARSRAPARFNMSLAVVFAGLSLLLACIGLYGVISYSVAQRTSELAVRAALGASRGDLLGLVLRQGGILIVVGVGLGLVLSIATVGWLQNLLFGISAFDPLTFAVVLIALCGTALLACYLPARRAARTDAAAALRAD